MDFLDYSLTLSLTNLKPQPTEILMSKFNPNKKNLALKELTTLELNLQTCCPKRIPCGFLSLSAVRLDVWTSPSRRLEGPAPPVPTTNTHMRAHTPPGGRQVSRRLLLRMLDHLAAC